jgi:hypothetical protein
METPAEPDVKTQPMGDAIRPNETHNTGTAYVEDGTEQPLVRVANNEDLESFPLLRLPVELRTDILKMVLFSSMGISLPATPAGHLSNIPFVQESDSGYVVFDPKDPNRTVYKHLCTKTLWVIGFMKICHQIRSETRKLLSSNDINVHGVDFDKLRGRQHGILRNISLIRRVSSFTGKSSGRVVLWGNWDGHCFSIYEAQRRQGLPPATRIPDLDDFLTSYAQAIQPFQLCIVLSMNIHNISGFRDVCLCKRDAPVMVYDCRRIQCIVPLGDRVKARKMVDEAVDARLALLRRHFLHKWCYVRAMRSKLESGLVMARQYMREEVDRIC